MDITRSMAEIESVLDAWNVPVRGVQSIEVPGVYHVDSTDGERYVLKNVGGMEMATRTDVQFRVTRHVHESGIPIAYLLPSKRDSFYCTDGSEMFVLMPFLHGEETNFYGPESSPAYRNLGIAYGRLHACLAEFDGAIDTRRIDLYDLVFNDYAPRWLPHLAGDVRTKVEATLEELRAPLQLLTSELPVQVILLDCHVGNVRMVRGEFHGFIDCDHICMGQRFMDVVTALSSMVRYVGRNGLPVGGDRDEQRGYWLSRFGQFLSGYHGVNPLSEIERDNLWLGMLSCCFPDEREIKGGVPILEHMDWFYSNRKAMELVVRDSVPLRGS